MFDQVRQSHGGSSAGVPLRRGHPQCGTAGAGIQAGVTRSVGGGAIRTLWLSWEIGGVQTREHRRELERVSRSPGDDPSVFAMELETLARRAFADVNVSVRFQLVRDRFIACGRVMPKTWAVGMLATSRNVLGRPTRW